MGATNTKPISVNNLNWSFGEQKVLERIDLTFEKGRFTSIIGPNGSGKTTLLKNLSRILIPEHDRVFIDGRDITKMKNREAAKKIASVPQNTSIDFDFTALDIVLMGRTPYIGRFRNESAEDLRIAEEAMRITNTWHLRDKGINNVSGGERQRIIVARALAQSTGILLLDEPISQLDIHHQIELMDTVRSLVDNKGITVAAVLHDLNLAAQYSDTIILMNQGNIVAKGSPMEVLTKENIESVYKIGVVLMDNPVTGKLHVIPVQKKKQSKETNEEIDSKIC